MQMVPYKPLKRTYDAAGLSIDSNAMQIVPYQSNSGKVVPRGFARNNTPSNVSTQQRSNRRRRDKWLILDTRTNPVYPRPEVKYLDGSVGTSTTPTPILNDGSTISVINQIPQGVSSGQRLGAQVSTKSVYYQMVINIGTTQVPVAIRHILYWDRQFNGGTAPAIGNILASQPYLTSPINLQNRDRMVILCDDRITLSPNGDQIRLITGFRNINQRTTYTEGSALPNTGGLCLLLVSDEATGSTAPTIYGVWRIRYLDN